MEYPQYVCHKQVGAVKIAKVDPGADGSVTLHLEGGFDNVVVPHHDVKHKPKPEAGMYLVQYDNGYISFSPAKAFEKGYTKLPEGKKLVGMLMQITGDVAAAPADPSVAVAGAGPGNEAILSAPVDPDVERVLVALANAPAPVSSVEDDDADDDDDDDDDPEIVDAASNHGQDSPAADKEQPDVADEQQPAAVAAD